MSNKPRICVVTYPRPSASIIPLSNLVKILFELSDFLYLITGNEGEHVLKTHSNISGYSVKYKYRSFIITRILSHITLQLKIAIKILRNQLKDSKYETILMNTALAFTAIGKASDFNDGVSIAKNTIESGDAYKKLEQLVEISGGNQEKLANLSKI